MRPLYENSSSLSGEQQVSATLSAAWSCELIKLPIKYGVDFAITRDGKCRGFCEAKTRAYKMADIGGMGGYMLSLDKWMAAKKLCDLTGLGFILVVKAKDDLYYSRFQSDFKPDDIVIGGRGDRGDWQDIEPCIILNINRFKRVVG